MCGFHSIFAFVVLYYHLISRKTATKTFLSSSEPGYNYLINSDNFHMYEWCWRHHLMPKPDFHFIEKSQIIHFKKLFDIKTQTFDIWLLLLFW